MNTKIYILAVILLGIVCSCGKDEMDPYDQAFIHIMKDNSSDITVSSNRRDIVAYTIYLSSTKITSTLEVTYSIVVGDGLIQGLDFNIITNGNTLMFPSGIYDMPIRIQWLDNNVDPAKDNTIRIILENNNLDIPMGLPGPDELQRELVITKVN